MTCFELPVSLCKRIQSAITRFWWDDSSAKKNMAWIAWSDLTKPKAFGGLGFCDFQRFNEASLEKLSWRMMEKPETLLGRILKGKYLPNGDIFTCEMTSAGSHGWRSVPVGRDLLRKNLGWLIGNGKEINIWNDPWLDLSKKKRPYGPAPEAFINLTVADLRTRQGGEWDLEKIRLVLPQYEEDILSLKPSLSNAEDKLVWLGNRSGRCKRCGESESITHLLFHCPYAQQVWRDAPLSISFDPRGIVELEVGDRWTELCSKPSLPPTGIVSSSLVPWILWTLWKERNKFVFDGTSVSPAEALTIAIKAAKEWDQTQDIKKDQAPPSALDSELLEPALVVIRSNAAWRKEDKKAGIGWTVQTRAVLQRRKKTLMFVSSPLMAEDLAVREALMHCKSQGLDSIRLESDSAELIKAIKRKEPISELHGILSDIASLCSSPPISISFSWIPRLQNVVADSVAKEALCMVDAIMAPT
ncbi:uncharacterized protein LOC106355208 [Brassica napus]|uniref:uncharacterized protein LOC106355208 n=1 Tax=Brassica napus TaxID=3708 RepID=UPI0006AB1140|nr:uncharacterized protein LOC106355208 [Brassica napus]